MSCILSGSTFLDQKFSKVPTTTLLMRTFMYFVFSKNSCDWSWDLPFKSIKRCNLYRIWIKWYFKVDSMLALQALQKVNERLLKENPAESLLFDVILITTESQQQQQSSRITESIRHHGKRTSTFRREVSVWVWSVVEFCSYFLLALSCRSQGQQVLFFQRGGFYGESAEQ